jgi:response regulator RpfG family c-di-GMP phosphodiesterase
MQEGSGSQFDPNCLEAMFRDEAELLAIQQCHCDTQHASPASKETA